MSRYSIYQIVPLPHFWYPLTRAISDKIIIFKHNNIVIICYLKSNLKRLKMDINRRLLDLRNNIETISIQMPRLNSGLVVLENNFHKVMKSGSYNWGAKVCWACSEIFLDRVQAKDPRNVVPISQFQWGAWINVRHSINCVSKLSTNLRSWVSQNNCPCYLNGSIMEWSLGVRSRSIGSQVQSSKSPQKNKY